MRYSKRDGRKEWREKAKRSQEPKGRGELERWEGRGCFSWTFQSRITRVERVRHNKKSLAKKTEKKNISDSVSVWLVQRPVNKFPVHLLKTKGRPLYIHGHLLWSFGIASSVFPSLSALPPRDFRLGGANRKRKEDRISGLARERERETQGRQLLLFSRVRVPCPSRGYKSWPGVGISGSPHGGRHATSRPFGP